MRTAGATRHQLTRNSLRRAGSMVKTALVVSSPALVVDGRLQKKDGTLSIRAERFERVSLEESTPELQKTGSPPYPRHRESTPPSHDFR